MPHLKQKLGDFKLCLPIIVALRNPHLRKRHIVEVQRKIGFFFVSDEGFTLGDLLDLKVNKAYRFYTNKTNTFCFIRGKIFLNTSRNPLNLVSCFRVFCLGV